MENIPAPTVIEGGDALRTVLVALAGLLSALSTLVTIIIYQKVMELRGRVKDVQHKVGADNREKDG